MAIKIEFDSNNNALQPTLVLMTKKEKRGKLPVVNMQFKDVLNAYSEGRFDIYKKDCSDYLWNNIVDFKLVWVKEWNKLFELTLDKKDDNTVLSKSCNITSLGEAELTQINLYNVEINTETDISRDDYEPTIIYNAENPNASLLNRITEKIPHYVIGHVDESIAKLQRPYTFDNISIYDAFMQISEDNNCMFTFDCYLDDDGNVVREINGYDLFSTCNDCGYRGDFVDECPECGSTNITSGYGEDTTILVSSENLTNEITLTTDSKSVKNCLRVLGGDDQTSAAFVNCNPNGTPYIWYFSDSVKQDMSEELVTAIESYEELYNTYKDSYTYVFDSTSVTVSMYNALIDKYSAYTSDYSKISSSIIGYSNLMETNYEAIDFNNYLSYSLMPSVQTLTGTTAEQEATNLLRTLASAYNNRIGTKSTATLSSLSVETANNMVVQTSGIIVNPAYKVSIYGASTLSSTKVWTGHMDIVNYSDDEDDYKFSFSVTFTDNYELYVTQSIDKVLSTQREKVVSDIVDLFNLSLSDFNTRIKEYSLSYLRSLANSCEACLNILIQQGIADGKTYKDTLYQTMYKNNYYAKANSLDKEIALREKEITQVSALLGALTDFRNETHEALNLENYLGAELYAEFTPYRREDIYKNENYISDGLSDKELFANALDLFNDAEKELYKLAELQHSISTTMINLLVIPAFQRIVKYFAVGNWIRIMIDNELFRLRLMDYEIDFENLETLSVTFSDVFRIATDNSLIIEKMLKDSSAMALDYNSIKKQSDKGNQSYQIQVGWMQNGIDLFSTKIVSGGTQNATTPVDANVPSVNYKTIINTMGADVSISHQDESLIIGG